MSCYCKCSVTLTLPRGTVGWSAVCDCVFPRSYSLAFLSIKISEYWISFMFLLSADFFVENFSQKPQRQTFWIQIRPNVLPDLIWVQTVCKGYEQTTLVINQLEKNYISYMLPILSSSYCFNLYLPCRTN